MTPGRTGPSPLTVAAGIVVLVAGLIGVGLVERPGVVVPLTLQLLLLAGLTWVFLRREEDDGVRGWLVKLALAALAVRLLVFYGVHFVLDPIFFAPDAGAYEREGRALARHWMGQGPYPERIPATLLPSYYHLNAVFALFLDRTAPALAVLNMFAGAWTGLLTFYIGRETLGKSVGKVAAVLAAFFPSLVLWSVLNVRDALSTVVVALLVLLAVRAYRRAGAVRLLTLLAVFVALAALRDYMGFLVAAGLLVGWTVALRPERVLSTLTAGTTVVLFLAFVGDQIGLFQTITFDDPLEAAERMRRGLQAGATSAYGVAFDTSTPMGALRFIPYGLAFFLFAPFPWAVETRLQMAAVPETLLWYPVLALFVVGLIYAVRNGKSALYIPLAVLLVVTTSYALVEGNFGTAYRHRAQVMPLFFLFSAVGILLLKTRFLDVIAPGRRPRARPDPVPTEGGT